MRKYIYYLITIFVICSCNTKTLKQDNEHTRNILIQNTTEIVKSVNYDSIVKNVDIIRLELTDKSLLYDPQRVAIDDNENIFVLNGTSEVKMFNREGSFIINIGAKGSGPGEYIEARDFCVFENKYICILANGYIFMYDKNTGIFNKHIKIHLKDRDFYPEYISQSNATSFFIWDSNPANVGDYAKKFKCLLRVNLKGEILNSYYTRDNFIIEIGHLRNSYDGGAWLRPSEGNSELIKVKGESVSKEFEILFEDKLAPKDYFKNKKDNPYEHLDNYFNSYFIKYIHNISETKEYLHFSCIGKDYNFFSFYYNKFSNKVYSGLLNFDNPFIVCSDSLYFYSFYQDNDIDEPLKMDNVFKDKIENRVENFSYIFKYNIK